MDKNKKQQETKKQHKNAFYLCFSVLFQICQTCALYSEFDDSFPPKKTEKTQTKKRVFDFFWGVFFWRVVFFAFVILSFLHFPSAELSAS